jgi:membrane-associated phospholipid phosphatase
MSGNKAKDLEHTFNLEETAMALSYHRFDAETETNISSFVNHKDNLKPDEKFIYDFRPEWEETFRSIDDYLIGIGQHFHLKHKGSKATSLNKFMGLLFKAFSWFVTFICRVENLSSVNLFVLALGYDHIARFLTIIGMISGLFAQVPKRFLFRRRPYMVGRALPSGKLDTSSFPSRAVTCSVVYAFTAIYCYNYQTEIAGNQPGAGFGMFSSAILLLLAFLSSSFARIHLGAHYPSDCLGGLTLGLIISLTSWLLFQIPNIFGCPSCFADQCYPRGLDPHLMTPSNFELQNIGLGATVAIFVGIFLVLSSSPPLVFWNKSAPIFGTICACVVAEIFMVCPKGDSKGLIANSNPISVGSFLLAACVAGFQLITAFVCTKTSKIIRKLPIVAYTLANVLVYLFFGLGLLYVIIKVRLEVMK